MQFRVIEGIAYPRITSMLGEMVSKGEHFDTWLKNKGWFAPLEAEYEASGGTLVHQVCEDYIRTGRALTSKFKNRADAEKLYVKFTGFMEFCDKVSPTLIATEQVVCDKQCSGKYDIAWTIDGVDYVTDLKAGSGPYSSHFIQASFYAKCTHYKPSLLFLKDRPRVKYTFIDEIDPVWAEIYELYFKIYDLSPLTNKKMKETINIPDLTVRKGN